MPLNDYILVIADHDPETLASYGAMLEPKGYTVHVCDNGEEALRLCRTFRPAVAVLDLDMPMPDGCETARRLQADPELTGIRLIAITALSDERASARAWESGFHEFLPKPVPCFSRSCGPHGKCRALLSDVERAQLRQREQSDHSHSCGAGNNFLAVEGSGTDERASSGELAVRISC